MNPWIADQLVAGRREDLERAAGARRPARITEAEPPGAAPAHRTRPAVARHVGVLLIAVGRRLADTDTLSAAFDVSHRS